MKKTLLPLLEKIFVKNINTLMSVKFFILVMATVFFYKGLLSEHSWKEMALILAGIRSFDKMSACFFAKKGSPGG